MQTVFSHIASSAQKSPRLIEILSGLVEEKRSKNDAEPGAGKNLRNAPLFMSPQAEVPSPDPNPPGTYYIGY